MDKIPSDTILKELFENDIKRLNDYEEITLREIAMGSLNTPVALEKIIGGEIKKEHIDNLIKSGLVLKVGNKFWKTSRNPK